MLTEIKSLIKSDVEESLKKQKEEFDSAFMEKTISSDMVDYLCLKTEDERVANRRKNVVVLWFDLLVLSNEHYFTEKEP